MQPVTLRAFANAIFSSWVSAMSGPLSVPFGALAVYLEKPPLKIMFALLAFVAAWLAAYIVWVKERVTRNEAESSADHARAIREQTEEMRRQREQREREHDPALRAFREQRFRTISAGGGIEEQSFDILVYWIAVRSAWGKWQAAQNKLPVNPENGEPHKIIETITCSHFLDLLVEGRIIARATRDGDNFNEELSPDFWLTKFLRVVPDLIRWRKVEIVWRPDGSDTRPIGYHYFRADTEQIKRIFPERDEALDKVTAQLRIAQS